MTGSPVTCSPTRPLPSARSGREPACAERSDGCRRGRGSVAGPPAGDGGRPRSAPGQVPVRPLRVHRRGLPRHPRVLRLAGAAQPSADRGAGLHLDRRRRRLARLLADQPMGPGPRRPRARRPLAARPVRALADVDVGQHRRRRVPRLAARPERRPTGRGAGRVLRAGRVLAVGFAPRDHGVAGRPRTRRRPRSAEGLAVLRALRRGPPRVRVEHAPRTRDVRGGRGRVARRGAGADPRPGRRRRGRVRRRAERRGGGRGRALLPRDGAG